MFTGTVLAPFVYAERHDHQPHAAGTAYTNVVLTSSGNTMRVQKPTTIELLVDTTRPAIVYISGTAKAAKA